MNSSWRRRAPRTPAHRRMRDEEKPRALFSLDEVDKWIIPVFLLLATHAAAGVGLHLWLSGRHQLSPHSLRATLNGSGWTQYEVLLHNYSVEQACEHCCSNGRLTNQRKQYLGAGMPAWDRYIRFTIFSTPPVSVTDSERECSQPELTTQAPALCAPTPCHLPGGVWCFNQSCDALLLWRPPHEEAIDLSREASANVVLGPLLIMPAVMFYLYYAVVMARPTLCPTLYSYREQRAVSVDSSAHPELPLSHLREGPAEPA